MKKSDDRYHPAVIKAWAHLTAEAVGAEGARSRLEWLRTNDRDAWDSVVCVLYSFTRADDAGGVVLDGGAE